MPIPKIGKETRAEWISRCVREIKHEDPKRPTKECLGQCYSMWETAQKNGKKKGEKKV